MPRRRREEPRTAAEAFRLAMRYGRKGDHAKAEMRRFAQMAYDKFGLEILTTFPEELSIDACGRVHVRGEHCTWANGAMMLRHLAEVVVVEDWPAEVTANYINTLQEETGHEPAEAVRTIGRTLAGFERQDLPPAEVAAMLRATAERIERESEAADG